LIGDPPGGAPLPDPQGINGQTRCLCGPSRANEVCPHLKCNCSALAIRRTTSGRGGSVAFRRSWRYIGSRRRAWRNPYQRLEVGSFRPAVRTLPVSGFPVDYMCRPSLSKSLKRHLDPAPAEVAGANVSPITGKAFGNEPRPGRFQPGSRDAQRKHVPGFGDHRRRVASALRIPSLPAVRFLPRRSALAE
jgi:hypothetical protein